MAFPTLSRYPLGVEFSREDSTISTPLEAGYENRRPRHTRIRKTINVEYDLLPTGDKNALLAHQDIVQQSTSFVYTDSNNVEYTVYYITPFRFVEVYKGWWKFDVISMREV